LEEVKDFFSKEGYLIQDSIYISGKIPIEVTYPSGHTTAINLNNFMNCRRCSFCRRMKAIKERLKRIEMNANKKESEPRREVKPPLGLSLKSEVQIKAIMAC
jgi:hypothetical protein